MKNEFLRADELCKIIESIVGIEDVRVEQRKYPYPMLRAMVYAQMRKEGYSLTQIAEAFGKNHCTVIYMSRKCESIANERNQCWSDYLSVWDAFQKRLELSDREVNTDQGSRLTVSYVQMFMSSLPPDASVVFEHSATNGLRYDNEINTLFIRG